MVTITTTKTFYQMYWREYEIYCMKHYQEKYGHTTWHWMNVPESVLLKSGYINDFNRLRLKRKEAYERDGVFYNPIQEYGLDGFAEEKCGDDPVIYHGIQSKLWDPKSLLTANDVGTFQAVIWGGLRMKSSDSKGYLYHTCRLQADLLGYILNTRGIIQQELLPFDESHVKSVILPSQVSPIEVLPSISESTYILRGYQEEAIKALSEEWSGIGLLNLPCGTGKTVIFCNHLREKKYKNVIIVSPLRVHAEQTLRRVKAFLPEYDQLLLDSDGFTDVDTLNDAFEKKSVISTTFKSFVQVVRQLFVESTESDYADEDEEEYEEEIAEDDYSKSSSKESVYESLINLTDTLVIIDEAHNIVSMSDEKQKMIKIIQSFPKTLLVTATPPSCMEEMIGCTTIYQYPFRRAIEEGHICDYQIYLPMVTTDEATKESSVYIEKPIELASLNGDIVQKSLYLLSGMLQTGSKRCIAYLSQTKESNLFMKVLIETNTKYHYLDLTVNSIANLTSGSKRKKILEEFQKDDGRGEIKILCSIRILDEGVDIPVCDSVFIGNITESSNEIKMVQRICRANRLVESRPNKVARCFLWAYDHLKIIRSLSLLKENDVEFCKKISVLNGDYEKMADTVMIDLVDKHNTNLIDFIKVKCMSYEEIWEIKRQLLFEFCMKYGRSPTIREIYKGTMLGTWLKIQKRTITTTKSDNYVKLSENDIVKKSLDTYLAKREQNMYKPRLSWDEWKDLLFKFCTEFSKIPSCRDMYEGYHVGGWLQDQKKKISSTVSPLYVILSMNSIVKRSLDLYLGVIDTWTEWKDLLFEFCAEFKRVPIATEIYKGRLIGSWFSNQKTHISSTDSHLYVMLSKNSLVKRSLDVYLGIIDTWTEWKDLLFKFCIEFKRIPTNKEKYEGHAVGQWLQHQKPKISSPLDDIYVKLSVNPFVKASLDEYLGIIDTWEIKKNLLFNFCIEFGRLPGRKEQYEGNYIGQWLTNQKTKISSPSDDIYVKLSENKIVKTSLDAYLTKKKMKV